MLREREVVFLLTADVEVLRLRSEKRVHHHALQLPPRQGIEACLGAEAEEEEAMKEALEIASVNKAIDGKPIRKVIYVKGKILNIVAK